MYFSSKLNRKREEISLGAIISLLTRGLCPTKMQPCESRGLLPQCIMIPAKFGTFSRNGMFFPNFPLKRYATLYLPHGIAVFPFTFFSLLQSIAWGSNVSYIDREKWDILKLYLQNADCAVREKVLTGYYYI